MTTTFIWSPAPDVVGTTNFALRTAQFGDGYSQSVADGINNRADSWPLTFSGSYAYIVAIKAFLDALQGYQSFYWTPPMRGQGLFRCAAYSNTPHVTQSTGAYTLTATFTEVFAP